MIGLKVPSWVVASLVIAGLVVTSAGVAAPCCGGCVGSGGNGAEAASVATVELLGSGGSVGCGSCCGGEPEPGERERSGGSGDEEPSRDGGGCEGCVSCGCVTGKPMAHRTAGPMGAMGLGSAAGSVVDGRPSVIGTEPGLDLLRPPRA